MDLTKVPLNEYGHVQTRDGRPVRLLCVDAGHPVIDAVGLTRAPDGYEFIAMWQNNGVAIDRSDYDLIPVPRKHTVSGWLCISKCGTEYFSKEKPAKTLVPSVTAMREITVELTEGEGLT